jgi:uncharacterized membrane protein HdeD (DUF308 family)
MDGGSTVSTGREVETSIVVVETRAFPWWLLLIEGIAAVVIGVLLFAAPRATVELAIQLFGLFWLIDGVLRIVSAFIDPTDRWFKVLAGAIGIIAGILVIQHPLWLAVAVAFTLVLLIGGAGIVIGVISLIQAFRGGGWGVAVMGVLSLLFGLLLVLNPVLVGVAWVYLYALVSLVGGIVTIVMAFRLRRALAPV